MSTVASLREAIRARGFEADTDAQQLVFLNIAQRKVARDSRWRWTQATTTVTVVAGTADYTLPAAAAAGHVDSVRLTYAGSPVADFVHADAEELLDWRAEVPAGFVDTPNVWSLTGPTTIALCPTPSAAGVLSVRYRLVPPALTGDSDVPILPVLYHDLLVVEACRLMAQRERQTAAQADFQAEYDSELGRMRAQQGVEQQQTPGTVAESGYYDGV